MRLLALTPAFLLGCATMTATVRRTDDTPVAAEIDSSDASTLRLRGPSGNIVALDQSQVARIDHPGKIPAVIGAVCAAIGAVFMVPLGVEQAEGNRDSGGARLSAVIGSLYVIVGLPMFLANMVTRDESRARARAFESARPLPWMIAPAVPGRAEPLPRLHPPPGGPDEEEPDRKPPSGFQR